MNAIHDRNLTSCPLCGESIVFVASVSQNGAHVSATHAPPLQGCPLVERLRAMLELNAVPLEKQHIAGEDAN